MAHNAERTAQLRRRIRAWILFFILSIGIFGITAFPLESELGFLDRLFERWPGAYAAWVHSVHAALRETNTAYPFLAYGTDWLAFAHIIIALLFIGPFRDPVKNAWIIDWGILSCLLAFPLAFIAGPIRHVPFFHQLVDAGISMAGLFALLVVRRAIKELSRISAL